MNQKIIRDIMQDYEKIRINNKNILRERKNELYRRSPELLEIENNLSQIGIKISKMIVKEKSEPDFSQQLAYLQNQNQIFLDRYKKIIASFDLPKDFFEVYNCSVCKDTGYVGNKKCKCFVQKLIEKYYFMSQLTDVFQKENFDSFDLRYYKSEKISGENKSPYDLAKRALEKSLEFVNKFESDFINILFYGETGLGKTFLCNCIAKEILSLGKTVLYSTAPQLFKILEDVRFADNKEENKVEYCDMIFDADLLIIDDLGSEFITLPFQSELFNIINTRLLSKKPIVISSNLSACAIRNQYSDRIASRLLGNYVCLQFKGDDIRLKKKEKKKGNIG